MVRKVFPHPYLTLFLIVVWVMLVDRVAFGTGVMAVLVGTLIPLVTAVWWPKRPQIRAPLALLSYAALVVWDVIVANFQVARIVLFMPRDQIRSAFIRVPVELQSREAITLLAGTITVTPGTLTADMSSCGKALLIHALHAPDPDAVRDGIKSRYESRLKRIFG
ncbi:MAG: Na+/H+ antiporter subunit E [Pseudomonadota bacterium]